MGEDFNIQGVWINKNTGEKIIVRDSFIGDTGMQIITNDGESIDINDFSKNYMQASDEVYDESGNQIDIKELTEEDLGIEKTYKNDLFAVFDSSNQTKPELKENKVEISSPKNTNYDIIKKFFDKFDTKININFNINWTGIPKEGLNTLINYLDIDEDEVSDYIYDNYLDKQSLREILSKEISLYLNGN